MKFTGFYNIYIEMPGLGNDQSRKDENRPRAGESIFHGCRVRKVDAGRLKKFKQDLLKLGVKYIQLIKKSVAKYLNGFKTDRKQTTKKYIRSLKCTPVYNTGNKSYVS